MKNMKKFISFLLIMMMFYSLFTIIISTNLSVMASSSGYTINVTADSNGSAEIVGGDSNPYQPGTSITMKATPNTGYTFIGWQEGDVIINTSNPYTFNIGTSDRTIQARFSQAISITAVVAASTGGGSVTGGGTYNSGNTVTLRATPNTGHNFIGWFDDSGSSTPISLDATYTFQVTANSSLIYEARFARGYTITATAGTGGSVTSGETPYPPSGRTYEANASVTLTALPTPNSNYTFDGWYENGTRISTSNPYTFLVISNRTLQARFTADNHVITVNAAPTSGGTVTGGGTFPYGSSRTVTATPSAGYTFDGWFENGTRVSTSNSYTFSVTSDTTLEAFFIQGYYRIEARAGAGGNTSISGGGSIYTSNTNLNSTAAVFEACPSGTFVTMTATPNTGYVFDGWYENDVRISTNTVYTFNATSNRTLYARFSQTSISQITVTATAGTGGNATGSGTYPLFSLVTLRAAPQTGYIFDGWYENGVRISGNEEYMTAATTDIKLEARFVRAGNYVIAVTVGTGGNATGGGTYQSRSTAILRAAPIAGYTFDGWYEDNERISTNTEYTITVTENRTFQALFIPPPEQITYTVTATAAEGGNTTGGGVYSIGESVTLTAMTGTGYTFDGWYESGAKISTSDIYIFVATSSRTLQAKFTKASQEEFQQFSPQSSIISSALAAQSPAFQPVTPTTAATETPTTMVEPLPTPTPAPIEQENPQMPETTETTVATIPTTSTVITPIDSGSEPQSPPPSDSSALPQTGIQKITPIVAVIGITMGFLLIICNEVFKIKKKKARRGSMFMTYVGVLAIFSSAGVYGADIYEDYKIHMNTLQTAQLLREHIDNAETPKQYNIENVLVDERTENLIELGGEFYFGVLNIPALELELPINNEWGDSRLKETPCRYSGDFTSALVICAHNYKFHFGNISNLSHGDKLVITDANKEQHWYTVDFIETIKETDIDAMVKTSYPLTLFTCTPDGNSRIAVRCSALAK